jgi:hypothetical protein
VLICLIPNFLEIDHADIVTKNVLSNSGQQLFKLVPFRHNRELIVTIALAK